MTLVGVSRVLNEEDIIEAMVRHHAAIVDHHIILDNGSVDRTIEILAALSTEGLKLTVLQNSAVMFSEEQFNTTLYDFAVREHAADWVLFLDADEFVDTRPIGDLRALLAAVPPQFASFGVQMINYDAPTQATLHEINVVRKFVRRVAAPIGVWKVFVRAPGEGQHITINAGNHSINVNGVFVDSPRQDAFLLAHYPSRDPLHWAGKAMTGWLKVLAAGELEHYEGRSAHYRETFTDLARDPAGWVQRWAPPGANRVPPPAAGLVEDPIAYLGRPLLYTERVDYGWRSLRLLILYSERLALSYGRLREEHADLRQGLDADLRQMRSVIAHDGTKRAAGFGAVITSAWRCAGDPGFGALLVNGWGLPEAWGGVWGIGATHELRIILPRMPEDGVWIDAFVQVPLIGSREQQTVDVDAGGETRETWHFDRARNGAVRQIFIPQSLISTNAPCVTLVFTPRLSTIPAELNPESNDRRTLGLGVVRIRVREK